MKRTLCALCVLCVLCLGLHAAAAPAPLPRRAARPGEPADVCRGAWVMEWHHPRSLWRVRAGRGGGLRFESVSYPCTPCDGTYLRDGRRLLVCEWVSWQQAPAQPLRYELTWDGKAYGRGGIVLRPARPGELPAE